MPIFGRRSDRCNSQRNMGVCHPDTRSSDADMCSVRMPRVSEEQRGRVQPISPRSLGNLGSLEFKPSNVDGIQIAETNSQSQFGKVINLTLPQGVQSIGYSYSPGPGERASGQISLSSSPGSRLTAVDHPSVGKIHLNSDGSITVALNPNYSGTLNIGGQQIDCAALSAKPQEQTVTPTAPQQEEPVQAEQPLEQETQQQMEQPEPTVLGLPGQAPVEDPIGSGTETIPDEVELGSQQEQNVEESYQSPGYDPFSELNLNPELDGGPDEEVSSSSENSDSSWQLDLDSLIPSLSDYNLNLQTEDMDSGSMLNDVDIAPPPILPDEQPVDSQFGQGEVEVDSSIVPIDYEAYLQSIEDTLVHGLGFSANGDYSLEEQPILERDNQVLKYRYFSTQYDGHYTDQRIDFSIGFAVQPDTGEFFWREPNDSSWYPVSHPDRYLLEGENEARIKLSRELNDLADRLRDLKINE